MSERLSAPNWRCASCGHGNLAERDECRNCDAMRPTTSQRPSAGRLTAETEATIRQHAAPHSVSIRVLLNELDAVRRELADARKDSARLDWWEQHMNDGPCIGLYTDGVLGLGRGHLVASKWTVKGKGYRSLRDAIDAALGGAA